MKDKGLRGATPTIVDVAREAGVSRATAARALGDYGYASADTRQRVVDAAKRLAYQPNQLARSMVTGRSEMIGVVVADIENLYFARAIRAITDTASANGFGVVLATTDEDIELERNAVRLCPTPLLTGSSSTSSPLFASVSTVAAQRSTTPESRLTPR